MTKLYATTEQKRLDEAKTSLGQRPSMKVSCLGPRGSFSEYVAQDLCKGYEVVLCHSFSNAVSLLLGGETDYAVLPVENSINGGVQPVLDLLASNDLFGVAEYMLHVDHRLALLEGVKEEDIDTICSHEQAIGQCLQYLRQHFPHASYVGTSATSESIQRLNAHTAGIVGAHMKREGLVLSEENIADVKSNYTRFLLVQRGEAAQERSAMVFLCAVCAHKPGSLLGLLRIFQRHSLNLTRIESQPVRESFGEYRFFIEFAGDIGSANVKSALSEAQGYCKQFKLIGAYL